MCPNFRDCKCSYWYMAMDIAYFYIFASKRGQRQEGGGGGEAAGIAATMVYHLMLSD
jgi:hypothetical protein